MNRSQRALHQRTWWVLTPLLLGLLAWATFAGQTYPEAEPPAAR